MFFLNIRKYIELASVVQHHVRPVRLFVGPQPLQYDRVFRTDQMRELEEELTNVTGVEIRIPKLNESSQSLQLGDLRTETQAHLSEFLLNEYEHLKQFYENPFK